MKRLGKVFARRLPANGFTLVEVLIAMALTLLILAAMAKSFAFVGERIRDSRGAIALNAELLSITTRLRDELSRCTVGLAPAMGDTNPPGYFEYYEGPITNVTSSIFRVKGTVASPQLPDSRYGDIDDYLAFTAIAPEGSWFTGKVPRYLLDQRANPGVYTLPPPPYDNDPSTSAPPDPFDPIVIRSRYAEIVYFVCPEYIASSLPQDPVYVDVDGDTNLGSGTATENGFPDRLALYRRVLLIRPDLNINGTLPSQIDSTVTPAVPYLIPDDWPTGTNSTIAPAARGIDAWMFGMAGAHQQCDLSISRSINSSNGAPGTVLIANSLDDLAHPHNRFAHVRAPGNVVSRGGGSAFPTSMPVLALGPAATIFNAISPAGRMAPPENYTSGSPSTTSTATVQTPNLLSGFIRPEFVLGHDRNHYVNSGSRWSDRRGEDLLVNNLLGFDIKILDQEATFFTTTTSDLVVGPDDAGYRDALENAISNVSASETRGEFKGGYVDLLYPVLAGGALRGWQTRPLDLLASSSAPAIGTAQSYLISQFSGIADYSGSATTQSAYQNSLYRSGKLATNGNTVAILQPTFDTFTTHYERDGYQQIRLTGSEGTRWSGPGGAAVDLGRDGLDSPGIYGGGAGTLQQLGADDIGERETLPPFMATPKAVQISIRLGNPVTRQVEQASVIHRPD